MKKIRTLFRRNPAAPARLLPQVHTDCLWVPAGEGVATAKLDGVCTMLDADGLWWARRTIKRHTPAPDGFVEVEADPVTGKRVGWEPLQRSPFAKLHALALDSDPHAVWAPATYELLGPKINQNPHGFIGYGLVRHGSIPLHDVPTDFEELRDYLASWRTSCAEDLDRPFEGIVWHHPDGRMAKIKTRDFQ